MNLTLNGTIAQLFLVAGALIVIAAALAALRRRDLKMIIVYNAVSQLGYVLLGIGTANPAGIAGGLFHLLNTILCVCGMALAATAVTHSMKKAGVSESGGLARFMPITFTTFLIASLAMAGIPPLNGFVSKWMVYQGIIEYGKDGDKLWILWLIAAMFGNALTLESLLTAIHTVFLGEGGQGGKKVSEAHWALSGPMAILSILSVIFGIFAFTLPLAKWIMPLVPGEVDLIGAWMPSAATMLIVAGLIIGFVIYVFAPLETEREDGSYIGGETLFEKDKGD